MSRGWQRGRPLGRGGLITVGARGRAIGWTVAFLLCGFGLGLGLFVVGVKVVLPHAPPESLMTDHGRAASLIQAAGLLAGFGVATWACGFRGAGITPQDLRWAGPGSGGVGFLWGVGLGAVPAIVAMAVAIPVAGAAWRLEGAVGPWSGAVFGMSAVLLPSALVEEVIFRGVPLVLLARAFGKTTAIVSVAVLFAAAHVWNPAVSLPGLLNIGLAGVLLGTAFYLPGGLWTATGAHLGWNAALAGLGAPVSGIAFPMPGVTYRVGGPAWLSGGAFGPEGGVLASAALAGAIVVVSRIVKEQRT